MKKYKFKTVGNFLSIFLLKLCILVCVHTYYKRIFINEIRANYRQGTFSIAFLKIIPFFDTIQFYKKGNCA